MDEKTTKRLLQTVIPSMTSSIRLAALDIASNDHFSVEAIEQELITAIVSFLTLNKHPERVLSASEFSLENAQLWFESLQESDKPS